jgi:RISC-loading complex subunit TARBP2
MRATYSALKEGKKVATLTPQASQSISQFYANLKSKTGKALINLQTKAFNTPSSNFCQMLQEIAEEQRFEVTYVDIPDVSVSGAHQCLVQLSTLPVAVCHGTGTSKDDAHAQAAHNALQYLRIMTKK